MHCLILALVLALTHHSPSVVNTDDDKDDVIEVKSDDDKKAVEEVDEQ